VHRLRRRGRRLARRVAILIVSLFALVFLVLTQTGVTRSFVLPKIASMLPGEVTAGGVHLGLNGDIVIEDLTLRAPGVPGEPAEFLKTRKFRISLDPLTLGSDKPRATALTLVEPVARVSVDKKTNAINLASVVMPSGGTGGEVPRVYVRHGVIELGEHEGSTYEVLRRMRVDGELVPAKEADGSYTLSAREIDRTDAPGTMVAGDQGFVVEGRIGADAVELTLRRLMLADWRPERVPTIFRPILKQLDIDGVVDRAALDYDFKQGLSATLEVRGVGMNLPVSGGKKGAARKPEAVDATHPALRMRDVTGTIELARGKIEARAKGSLEELPYEVHLQYMGTTAEAPFVLELNTEGFELSQHPDLLRFAPEVAKTWADRFSNPTGIIDSWIEVSRGPGQEGKPGEIAVRGRAKFRGVTAAFHKFPYQFNDMSGVFYFDDKSIQFRDIQGRSAEGAVVTAHGTIAPPDQTAAVDLDIRITGVPIDRALLDAIGPGRRQILDDLLSRPVFDDLAARGLITKAESIEDVIAAGPVPVGKVPAFALGGRADVHVQIKSDLGHDSAWHDDVDVVLPKVGMLPENFRYPIIGEDVKLRIADSKAEVVSGRFRGLHGGEASLHALVSLPDATDSGAKVSAKVDVSSTGVPIDPLLLYAVPEAALGGPGGEARNARELVEMLQITGDLSCTAHIGDREDGSMAYAIQIQTKGAKAEPRRREAPTGIRIEDLDATVNVESQRIAVKLSGQTIHGSDPAGTLSLDLEALAGASWSDHPSLNATLDVRGLDIASPIEDLAAIFSVEASKRVLEMRNIALPGGRVGVRAKVASGGGEHQGEWSSSLVIDQADGLFFSLPEGRVILSESDGRIVVEGGVNGSIRFEDFWSYVSDNDGPVGRVGLSGSMLLSDGKPSLGSTGVKLAARGLRVESPLVRGLLENRVGGRVGEAYKTYRPEGTIDGEVMLRQDKDTIAWSDAWVGPRSLALDYHDQRLTFPSAGGRLDLNEQGATFSGIKLEAPQWSVKADGAWTYSNSPQASSGIGQFEMTYDLTSNGLPKDLLAVLPKDVTDILAELDAGSDGSMHVRQGVLSIRNVPDLPGGAGVSARGTLDVEKSRLNVGLPITDCDGSMRFEVEKPEGQPAKFTLAADLPTLRISGVRLSQGLVRVESGAEPGRVRVPLISAACHNGRLAGDARLEPGPSGQRRFDARVQISGARFGPLLADLREGSAKDSGKDSSPKSKTASKPEPKTETKPETRKDEDPDVRGALDAELTLSGNVGDPSSRRGRGTGRIGGGRVLSMPLTMALIRFSNFQLPLDERLELAKASFYIDGPIIGFDELAIYSRSIEISGGGTMTWPDTNLDMRFNSRSLSRVPVISEIIEGIRDNLITTRVRGTLDDPDIGVASPADAKPGADRSGTDRPAPPPEAPAAKPTKPSGRAGGN